MTDKQIENMILNILEIVDYDIYKEYLMDSNLEDLNQLVEIVKKHLGESHA